MPSPRADRALQALLIGFLLLALAVGGSLWLAQRQQTAFGWVQHTLEVQKQLATVLSHMQDAETGQRGYLLTGETDFLKPYNAAVAGIDKELDRLDVSIADNPSQKARARKVRSLIHERIARLQHN